MKHWIVSTICILGLSSCASFNKSVRSLFGKEEPQAPIAEKRNEAPRFSKQESYHTNAARKYRMSKDRMEQEADLQSNAGSLWTMEGQSAYLFAPNTTRLIGDLLNVKVEGAPKQQLQAKVKVITKLLDRIDHPENPLLRAPANANGTTPGAAPAAGAAANAQNPAGAAGANGQNPAAGAAGANAGPNAQAANEEAKPDSKFDVQNVLTRVTEVLKDGSYRVRGVQPFMIGKREYKVIVTGIVRPEDFNDEGINASKLLDSQFDVVSNKKATSL